MTTAPTTRGHASPSAGTAPRTTAGPGRAVPAATAVGLELAKARRLRLPLIAAALVLVALGLSLPIGSSARAALTGPDDPWPQLLLGTSIAAALVSPLLTAVLASRLTDVEHTGGGWTMAAASGLAPGRLCRAKTIALVGPLTAVVALQVGGVLLASRALGATAPVSAAHWGGYAACLLAVDTVSCGWHVLLAARVENQIVTVGVGFLGSFISLFCLLMPPWLCRLVPWGYWALITPAAQDGAGTRGGAVLASYTTPPVGWVLGFLILAGAALVAFTARLDRIER